MCSIWLFLLRIFPLLLLLLLLLLLYWCYILWITNWWSFCSFVEIIVNLFAVWVISICSFWIWSIFVWMKVIGLLQCLVEDWAKHITNWFETYTSGSFDILIDSWLKLIFQFNSHCLLTICDNDRISRNGVKQYYNYLIFWKYLLFCSWFYFKVVTWRTSNPKYLFKPNRTVTQLYVDFNH